MIRSLVVGFAALALASPAARGSMMLSFSDSVPLQSTNYDSSVSISKFDASLGTLTSVTFALDGRVTGEAGFESLDASESTVTGSLSAKITLQRPDASPLVVTLPAFNFSEDVTALDGTIDFGGTSGKTWTGIDETDGDSLVSTSLSDLALFTGAGSIILPVIATGTSTASGSGNLSSFFSTNASANVTVTYTYEPVAVPEPSTAVMGATAIAGLGLIGLRRRHRSRSAS